MKKYLLFSLLSFFIVNAYSQVTQVPDPGFESWNTTVFYQDPVSWVTSNENYIYIGKASVFQTSDSYHGSYALKVQTVAENTDTVIGLAQIGTLNADGYDVIGIPCNVKPTALQCWVKYSSTATDQASIFVNFKKNGNYISYNTLPLTGSVGTYTQVTLTWAPLSVTPDTVVIGISSSLVQVSKKNKLTYLNVGNWLEVDDMTFTGANLPIPNFDFEQWNPTQSVDPVGWASLNKEFVIQDSLPYSTKTAIAHSGSSALRIQAKETIINGFFQNVSFITTGSYNTDLFNADGTPDIKGGFPIRSLPDSVRFWYQYDNSSNIFDSALFILDIKGLDSVRRIILKLPPVDSFAYVSFAIPSNIAFTPDSANITLSSVNYFVPVNQGPGNVLIMDDISFYYNVVTYQLNGNVFYDNASKSPLTNNIKVYLENTQKSKLDSVFTDNLGNFVFNNVQNGTYSLVLKTAKKARASTAVDALTVNRAYVKLIKITDPMKISAADVNGDTKINTIDALTILRRVVKLITVYPVPDWIFQNTTVTVNNADVSVTIQGICAGDVSGIYKPPAN